VEADVITSTAGNNVRTKWRGRTGSTGVLEHGEHERVILRVPGRPLAFPKNREGIPHTRSISSEVGEMVQEGSDSLIVPKKPVMTVEGRGGHMNRLGGRNIDHTGGGERWQASTKR
jgi:hypothetical protein